MWVKFPLVGVDFSGLAVEIILKKEKKNPMNLNFFLSCCMKHLTNPMAIKIGSKNGLRKCQKPKMGQKWPNKPQNKSQNRPKSKKEKRNRGHAKGPSLARLGPPSKGAGVQASAPEIFGTRLYIRHGRLQTCPSPIYLNMSN